jgi:hypothetical protein
MGNGRDHDGRMPSDVCDDVRLLMRHAMVPNPSWRPRSWHHRILYRIFSTAPAHTPESYGFRCLLRIGSALAIMLVYSILLDYDVAGLRIGTGKEERE